MALKVALAAEEAAGIKALRLVAERGHDVAAVFTSSGAEEGRTSVAAVAESLGAAVRDASEVKDAALAGWLEEQGVDLLLNVHSLHIAADDVVRAPRLGAYNLHPGPLPERAGLNSPSWALYEGAEEHGVTLHRMVAGVDEGAIAFEERFPLEAGDTGLSVLMRCVSCGMPLIERLLDAAESDSIPAHEQDLSRRRWYDAGPPDEGRLDWDRPAQRVADFLRACDYRPYPSPWGFPVTFLGDKALAVRGGEVDRERGSLPPGTVVETVSGTFVAAADACVRLDEVELDGRVLPAANVLRDGQQLRSSEPTGAPG